MPGEFGNGLPPPPGAFPMTPQTGPLPGGPSYLDDPNKRPGGPEREIGPQRRYGPGQLI